MKNFTWRKYISIGLALSFFMIAISGVVLYIAPPGRVARWINWIMLGLNRSQWENQHTLFSYLFIFLGIVHLFSLNWKIFTAYLFNGNGKNNRSRKEAIAALLSVLVIFFFTLLKVPPVISVMDLGNRISDTWSERIGNPPVPGIEDMTLEEISERFFEADGETVINQIREHGYFVEDRTQTLKDVAEENEISPMEVFRCLNTSVNDFYNR